MGAKKAAAPAAKGLDSIVKKASALQRLVIEYVPIDSIKPNSYNPNRQDEKEFQMLQESMAEDGFCVEAQTPVLCADLVWRPAGQLRAGQEIVAFDEERDQEANFKHGRRFRTATVTANALFEDELYEVRTEQGDVVRCNAQHPWLTRRTWGPAEKRVRGAWVETRALLPGDEVVRLFTPWEFDDSFSGGWLSGFLDGEGCIATESKTSGSARSVCRLSVTQKPGTTADKMVREMQRRATVSLSVVEWSKTHPERHWQDNVRVRVDGMADIMSLLGSVRPGRLLENAGRFWEGRSIGTRKCGRFVASVSKVGRGQLSALSTSTKTYIANGFAVHNTQPIVVQRATREIVDGEHRWRAARAAGLEAVPVVLVDMTEEQMRISTLRHNRARGAEDQSLVTQVLQDLRELGALNWAQEALQIPEADLKVLLDDVPVADALAGEEYGEGWSPVRNLKEGASEKSEVRMHPSVQEMNKQLNVRLAQATTPEERQAIETERRANTFRISVVFGADDVPLINEVLGGKPVETLLACCTAYERLEPE